MDNEILKIISEASGDSFSFKTEGGKIIQIGEQSADGVIYAANFNNKDIVLKIMISPINNEMGVRNIIIDTFCAYYVDNMGLDITPKVHLYFATLIPRKQIVLGFIGMDYGGKTFSSMLPFLNLKQKMIVISEIFDNLIPKLHSIGIHHSDLHFGNVLLDENSNTVKIIDFSRAELDSDVEQYLIKMIDSSKTISFHQHYPLLYLPKISKYNAVSALKKKYGTNPIHNKWFRYNKNWFYEYIAKAGIEKSSKLLLLAAKIQNQPFVTENINEQIKSICSLYKNNKEFIDLLVHDIYSRSLELLQAVADAKNVSSRDIVNYMYMGNSIGAGKVEDSFIIDGTIFTQGNIREKLHFVMLLAFKLGDILLNFPSSVDINTVKNILKSKFASPQYSNWGIISWLERPWMNKYKILKYNELTQNKKNKGYIRNGTNLTNNTTTYDITFCPELSFREISYLGQLGYKTQKQRKNALRSVSGGTRFNTGIFFNYYMNLGNMKTLAGPSGTTAGMLSLIKILYNYKKFFNALEQIELALKVFMVPVYDHSSAEIAIIIESFRLEYILTVKNGRYIPVGTKLITYSGTDTKTIALNSSTVFSLNKDLTKSTKKFQHVFKTNKDLILRHINESNTSESDGVFNPLNSTIILKNPHQNLTYVSHMNIHHKLKGNARKSNLYHVQKIKKSLK